VGPTYYITYISIFDEITLLSGKVMAALMTAMNLRICEEHEFLA
jgi:hypothetical protein